MADPQSISVPDLIGLTKSEAESRLKTVGLAVGSVATVSSATKPMGSVLSTNPASGAAVSSGSAVNLEVSSGPAAATPVSSTQPAIQVVVPDVVGLTRQAAEVILKNAGLAVGAVRTHHSNSVPAGGISDTNPGGGTLVNPASAVELDLSNGPETNWTEYIIPSLFVALGLVVLGVIGYIVTPYGQKFLDKLAENNAARGLITFLIAIATVGIAIILAISTLILAEGDAGDKRFDRGKQVLSILIGVLGTIVGFYFGSAGSETKTGQPNITVTEQAKKLTITTGTLPDGAAGVEYPLTTLQATGGTPPLKWSVTPALPADLSFDGTTGKISGKAKAALPKTKFTFTVMDSATPPASFKAELMLEIK